MSDPAPCDACRVPEDHTVLASFARLRGRHVSRDEVQAMATALCNQRGNHDTGDTP